MHIFLTGNINVGKSTLIERALASHRDIRLGGFRTVCGSEHDDSGVFIVPASADSSCPRTEQNKVGNRKKGEKKRSFPDVFNTVGLELLKDADSSDIIIMDELGKMETGAGAFTARVLEILDGETQVLGVLKPKQSPFLDAVREHPNTKIIEVTPQNRDEALNILKKEITRLQS